MQRILGLVLLVAIATPCFAQADPASEEAGKRALRDLESLLQSEAVFEGRTPESIQNALTEGHIFTRPVATIFPTVCRRDMIAIGYAGYEFGGKTNLDRAKEPFGVRAVTQYTVLGGEGRVPLETARGYEPLKGPCTALKGTGSEGWFEAENYLATGDAYTAAFGYDALMIALATIRSGKRQIEGCHEKKGKLSWACKNFADGQFPRDLTRIAGCPSKLPDPCYLFNLTSGAVVTVRMNYRGSKRDAELNSIEIDENNDIIISGEQGD